MKNTEQILEEIKKVKIEMKSVRIEKYGEDFGKYREYLRGMLDGLLFSLELENE